MSPPDPGVNAWAREKRQRRRRLNSQHYKLEQEPFINELKFQSSARHHHGCSADTNLFDAAGLALNFEADAARTIDEVALLDHQTIDAVGSFDTRRVMIDQATTPCPV